MPDRAPTEGGGGPEMSDDDKNIQPKPARLVHCYQALCEKCGWHSPLIEAAAAYLTARLATPAPVTPHEEEK